MMSLAEIEPTHLPIEAQLVGEFTPREGLGVDFDEPRELGLLDASLMIYRSEVESGSYRFDVTFEHPPLDDVALLALLNEVAPARDQQGSLDVIADWNILDPPRVDQPSTFDKPLVHLHRRLGKAWDEFAVSQPAFIGVMRNDHPETPPSDGSIRDLERYAEKRSMLNVLIKDATGSIDNFIDRLKRAQVKDAERIVMDGIARSAFIYRRKNRPRVVSPQMQPELVRRFQAAPEKNRLALLQRLVFSYLNEEQTKRLVAELKKDYDWATFTEGKVPFPIAYPKHELPEDASLAEAVLAPRTESYGTYDREVVDIPNVNGGVKTFRIPSSARRVRPGHVISPHLAWERYEDGTAKFVHERRIQGDESDPEKHYIDGVLGALVLAYLQPNVRDEWTSVGSIGNLRQRMGAAQVPVLALMRSKQLLKSDFVQAVETTD